MSTSFQDLLGIHPKYVQVFRDENLPVFAEAAAPQQIDPAKLARHWSVASPEGRAWLACKLRATGEEALGTGECAILTWAFAAELASFGVPLDQAAWLVQRGLTLRDVGYRPAQHLVDEVVVFGGPLEYGKPGGAPFPWPDESGLRSDLEQWQREIKEATSKGNSPFLIRFYDLLVVSDFHMATGSLESEEGLTRYRPTEDYFYDAAFFRFLQHHEAERLRRGGYPYELVFNGDVFDFAQAVIQVAPPSRGAAFTDIAYMMEDMELAAAERHHPPTAQPSIDPHPRRKPLLERLKETLRAVYAGWDWDQIRGERAQVEKRRGREGGRRKVQGMSRQEALDQLNEIYIGHRRFFQGLAWFLAQGNRLVVLRGNHDPQWYWPEVQLAFILQLKEAYDTLLMECRDSTTATGLPLPAEKLAPLAPSQERDPDFFESRVDFDHSWFYYRERLAYLSHGSQYDALNAQRYFLQPACVPPKQTQEEPMRPVGLVPQAPRAGEWLPDLQVDNKEEELDPPMGSLGLVYMVNNMEILMPNFERPGHLQGYVRWLLFHNPRFLFNLLWNAGRKTLLAWKDWGLRQLQHIQPAYQGKLAAYANLTGLPQDCLQEVDDTSWVRRWRRRGYGLGLALGQFLLFLLPIVLFVLALVLIDQIPFLRTGISVLDWLKWKLLPGAANPKLIPHPTEPGVLIVNPTYIGSPTALTLVLSALKAFLGGLAAYWGTTWLRNFIGLGEDYLYQPSRQVARILKKHRRDVPYLLFGHDHAHNAQPLDAGKWCSHCQADLHKGHVRLEGGFLKVPEIRCSQYNLKIGAEELREQVAQALPQDPWVERYSIVCPHCGNEVVVEDGMEQIRCAACEATLSWEQVALAPLARARLEDLGVTELSCLHCDESLPAELVAQIEVVPQHATVHCPECGRAEHQRMGGWSPGCPVCGRRLRKGDVRLTETGVAGQCRGCGHRYPLSPVRRWYLNTGSWLHESSKVMERKRLVRGEREYAFVRMVNTHRVIAAGQGDHMDPWSGTRPRVQLLRWNDDAGRSEPCETFQGLDEGL